MNIKVPLSCKLFELLCQKDKPFGMLNKAAWNKGWSYSYFIVRQIWAFLSQEKSDLLQVKRHIYSFIQSMKTGVLTIIEALSFPWVIQWWKGHGPCHQTLHCLLKGIDRKEKYHTKHSMWYVRNLCKEIGNVWLRMLMERWFLWGNGMSY